MNGCTHNADLDQRFTLHTGHAHSNAAAAAPLSVSSSSSHLLITPRFTHTTQPSSTALSLLLLLVRCYTELS